MAAAALLLVVACGGDDETDTSSDEPTATEANGNGDESPEATDDSGDGEGGGDSDLSALAADYGDFEGIVKYETTGFGDDSFTTMTIYRADGKSRVDYEGAGGSGTFLTNAEGSFACTENQCLKVPTAEGADPTALLTAFINPETIASTYGDLPDGVNVEESSEEIAGLDATCYEYSGDLDEEEAGDETGQVCFSDSGILLRLDFTGSAGGGKFEAVEAEDGTADADFDPPYDVVDLSNLGQ
jgi:hypothetical protein